jgi:hypothetical protein
MGEGMGKAGKEGFLKSYNAVPVPIYLYKGVLVASYALLPGQSTKVQYSVIWQQCSREKCLEKRKILMKKINNTPTHPIYNVRKKRSAREFQRGIMEQRRRSIRGAIENREEGGVPEGE